MKSIINALKKEGKLSHFKPAASVPDAQSSEQHLHCELQVDVQQI